MPRIHGQIDGIRAEMVQFELLDVDDKIGDGRIIFRTKLHLQDAFESRHHRTAIFINDGEFQPVFALLDAGKSQPERDGALRVHHR